PGERERVIIGDSALLGMAQNRGQVLCSAQRPVTVGEVFHRQRERIVPFGPVVLFQIFIAVFERGDLRQPQLLDQTVLRGLKTAFHSALGGGEYPGVEPTPSSRRLRPSCVSRSASCHCCSLSPLRRATVNIEWRSVYIHHATVLLD